MTDPFQPRVLDLNLFQSAHVVGFHPAELRALPVIGLLAHLMMPRNLRVLGSA